MPFTHSPADFGPTWDHIINLITEHEYRPAPKLIIGPAKWARVLQAADDEDRAVLEAMEASGQVIVSHHLPDPEVAYRYEPREEFRVLAQPHDGYVDRMTDAIRRAAGGQR